MHGHLASFISFDTHAVIQAVKMWLSENITVRRHFMLEKAFWWKAWIAIHKISMTVAYTEYLQTYESPKVIIKIARQLVNRIYYVLKIFLKRIYF